MAVWLPLLRINLPFRFCESTKETDLAALHINPRGEPAIVHPRDPVGGPTHGIGGSFGKGVQSVVDVHRFTVTESADEVDGSLTAGIAAFRAGEIEEAEQYVRSFRLPPLVFASLFRLCAWLCGGSACLHCVPWPRVVATAVRLWTFVQLTTPRLGAPPDVQFLNALHTVLDPSIQSAIVNASLLPMDEAREECRRIVALEQQRKGGVHYLLGLSLLYQDKWPEAAASLLTAANQTVSWLCLDGMKVDAADPSFHHSIGTSLTDVGKFDVAMIALEEALTRAPRQTQWLVELNAVRRRQGLVSVQLGATFPRVRTSLPRITPPCNAVLATTPSESTEEKQRPSSTHSATAGHAITPTTSPDGEHRSVEVDSVAPADINQSPDSTASPDDFRPNGETTEDTSMPEVAGVSPETASHTVEAETG
jgi:hypothetical protein